MAFCGGSRNGDGEPKRGRSEFRGLGGRPSGTTVGSHLSQLAEEQVRALNAELEDRVRERTAELTSSNAALEQFASVAVHDLQEPLRKVEGFTQLLAEWYQGRLDSDAGLKSDPVLRAVPLV